MKKHLIIILLSISFLSYSQEDFETLAGDYYTIKYPGTWELNQSGQMGMVFGLFAPVKIEGDQFRENVNFISQDVSSYNMDLTGFVNLSENQIKTMIQDGNILESTRVGDSHKVIYTGTMGQYKLKFLQQFWVIEGTAHILTFTAEQSEFENYQAVAQQIMNSFQLK